MTRAPGARRAPQAYRPGPTRRRISPGAVMLAIALVGSVLFALFAITVRDASQIPLLASGAAVLGIAFGALAVYSVRATWRAGLAGRDQRAVVLGPGRRHGRDHRGRAAWPARSSCSCSRSRPPDLGGRRRRTLVRIRGTLW